MDVLKELIEEILKNNVNAVNDILQNHKLKPDMYDEHGMTPLQHAAYKGNKDLVQLLIDQGADVNSSKHEYSYTALHFAALSGSTDVCQLLLENGAKTYATNSVGRTPSQMAAFVGNHACVTTINNFIPKSDIEYYCVPSGFETEPKLPLSVAAPLHKLIMEINLSPVKIAMNLLKLPMLFENIEKVRNVLELMSLREMQRGMDINEIMSFKFHYLSRIVGEIIKIKKELEKKPQEDNGNNKKSVKKIESGPDSTIKIFIKRMLRTRDGITLDLQENTLKEIVRGFHNRECTIFQQMVCTLSKDDSPSALSVITSIINGQRGFVDSDVLSCSNCGDEKATKKCSQCKSAQYCDRECQRYHWPIHKNFCTKPKNKKEEKENLKREEIQEVTAQALASELQKLNAS